MSKSQAPQQSHRSGPAPAPSGNGAGRAAVSPTNQRGNAFAAQQVTAALAASGSAPEKKGTPSGTGGAAIPASIRSRMEQRFGADFSSVKVVIDPELAKASTQAFTTGDTIRSASSQILSGSPAGDKLLAHELTHVVQQRSGRVGKGDGDQADPDPSLEAEAQRQGEQVAGDEPASVGGGPDQSAPSRESVPKAAPTQSAPAQRAGPAIPIIIWGGKALAATTLDHFIDFAIAAILGLPAPGLADDAINFAINLVPFLGEAKKVKKIAKLFELVDKVSDFVKRMKTLNKGGKRLLDNIVRESGKLREAIDSLELEKAKAAFGRLIGHVREGQVAAKLGGESGEKLIFTGMDKLRDGTKLGTDIDVVFKEGNDVVFGEVKALSAGNPVPGTKSWDEFMAKADIKLDAAKKYSDLEGVTTKLRYYVDEISDEARQALEAKGIDVVLNGTILN